MGVDPPISLKLLDRYSFFLGCNKFTFIILLPHSSQCKAHCHIKNRGHFIDKINVKFFLIYNNIIKGINNFNRDIKLLREEINN